MAITPLTGFKAFTFDGEKSTDYGVQILGEGVFNAPEREVEMINIPGRNGAFALDKGRFENIEVTYPANIIADSTADFAAAVSDLRNMLCSRRGYVRLQDDYHPDEYRMAVYKEGLEVDEKVLRAGEFEIVFDCMPQRFLISGDDAVDVANGQTITNPTRFESSPMLEVEGYGTIGFNNHEITINDVVIGEIETSIKSSQSIGKIPKTSLPKSFSKTINYSAQAGALESGDSLFVDSIKTTIASNYFGTGLTPAPTITSNIGTAAASGSVRNYTKTVGAGTEYFADYTITASISGIELTAFTNETYSATVTAILKNNSGNVNDTLIIEIGITNTTSGVMTITITYRGTAGGWGDPHYDSGTIEYGRTYLYSTQSILGSPLYVDCDLGVAYKYEGGTVVSIDQHVDLGSNLPTLAPGENPIAFDVTVTDLKITPRWWRI